MGLDHKHDPVLERAFDGLCSLSVNDEDRIIRLVVRRCGLNLIEVKAKPSYGPSLVATAC